MKSKITDKQRLAVKNMVRNGGVVSKAMVDAGYSPNTAKTPSKLTNTEGFKELADKYLPDDFLLEALNSDIATKRRNRKPELELAFKIKGHLSDRDTPAIGNLIVMMPPELIKKNALEPSPESDSQ